MDPSVPAQPGGTGAYGHGAGGAPLLSVCLIVRDEEARIARCLDSVQAFADEVVVVDTGSVDRTADIARSHGARVVAFAWVDDFAAARNAGLDAARGEWILSVDADEIVEKGWDRRRARAVLGAADAPAFTVEVRSPHGPGEPDEIAHLVRLFRRDPRYRYEGRIHETVLGSICRARGAQSYLPPRSGLRISHEGYTPELRAARGKQERNRRLLLAEIAARPGDPGPRYLFARENAAVVDGDVIDVPWTREALDVLEPALESLLAEPARGITEPSVALAIAMALATGDVERAARWCDEAKSLGPTRRLLAAAGERALALGIARDDRGLVEEALDCFTAAPRAPEGSPAIPTGDAFPAWMIDRQIVCRALLAPAEPGPNARAANARGPAPRHDGRAGRTLALAFATCVTEGPAAALGELAPALRDHPGDPRPWLALAVVMKLAGDAARAGAMAGTALKAAPDWSPAVAVRDGVTPGLTSGVNGCWTSLLRARAS